MNNQFVDYDTAKMLKAIGFREKCMGYYCLKEKYESCPDEEYDNYNSKHFELVINYSYHHYDGYFNEEFTNDITAPTWQQVEQYLWEKHKCYVSGEFNKDGDTFNVFFYLGKPLRNDGQFIKLDVDSPIFAKINGLKYSVKYLYGKSDHKTMQK